MRQLTVFIGLFLSLSVYADGKYSSNYRYIICDAPEKEWNDILNAGYFAPSSLDKEGFIHCATPKQLYRVMNKYFTNTAYRLFIIDLKDFDSDKLKYEEASNKDLYPHLYRKLFVYEIKDTIIVSPDLNGKFKLPKELQTKTYKPTYYDPIDYKPVSTRHRSTVNDCNYCPVD